MGSEVEMGSSQSLPGVSAVQLPASPSAQHFGEWRCRARYSSLPDPQDCDWPQCGCDPVATRVLESISESGCYIVREHLPRRQLERLAGVVGYTVDEMAETWALIIEALFFPLENNAADGASSRHEGGLRDEPSPSEEPTP